MEEKDRQEIEPDAVGDEGKVAGQCRQSQPHHVLHAEGGEHQTRGEIAGNFEHAHATRRAIALL